LFQLIARGERGRDREERIRIVLALVITGSSAPEEVSQRGKGWRGLLGEEENPRALGERAEEVKRSV